MDRSQKAAKTPGATWVVVNNPIPHATALDLGRPVIVRAITRV